MKQRPLRAIAMVLIVLAAAACGTGTPSATPTPSAAIPSTTPIPSATLPGPTPVPAQTPAADCVNPPPDIAVLSHQTDPVACYGNAPLTLDAYPVAVSVDCPVSGEPAWLGCPSGGLMLVGETRKVGAPFLLVAVDPVSGASLSGHFNTNVRITGHYDDPAAQTCRETGRVAALGTPEPAAATIEGCRRRFVVTQVVPLQP
jgi:hypothetical protein